MRSAYSYPEIVSFGVFEADLHAGELRRNGTKVHLQDLPFRMLALLLSRPNEIITHEELRESLWPGDVYVDFDRAIRSAVKRLRDALGDSADNPLFVETVERRGYRWIGPIRNDSPVRIDVAVKDETAPAMQSVWRKLIFALPVLAVLLAFWIFRPIYRSREVSAKSAVASWSDGVHKAGSSEAEDFYLKGRFYWNKRTPESLNQAVDAFTQAIIRDPNYAPAYMGLADSYNLLREYSAMPAREAYARAFAAATKAVELDDKSSEAHASLAFVMFYAKWDVAGAEREHRRAIELDPSNAKAHHWYATFLQTIGRHEPALVEIERARQLDPNSVSILADKGRLLWAAGRSEEALQLLKQMEAAEPDFASPHRYLRYAYFDTRDYPNYLAEMRKEATLTRRAADLAVVEAASKGWTERGERGLLESQLQEQKRLYDRGSLSPYWVAETASRLGRAQDALKYLEISAQTHDDAFLMLIEDRTFDNIRENATFRQLLTKISPPAN